MYTRDLTGETIVATFGEAAELVASDWDFKNDREKELTDVSFQKGDELEAEVVGDRDDTLDLQMASGSMLWRVPKKLFVKIVVE